MNDLIVPSGAENFDLSAWTPEMKSKVFMALNAEMVSGLQTEFINFRDEMRSSVGKQKMILTEAIRKSEEMEEKIEKVSNKQTFLNHTDSVEWLTLTTIGRNMNPTLNNKQISALLRRLIIIQKYGNIEPYSVYMDTKMPIAIKKKSMNSYGAEYFNYHFNEQRLLRLVESKLRNLNRFEDFKALRNSKEVWDFINSL